MPLPRAGDRTDPANKVFATVALIALCVMAPAVVFVQQFLITIREASFETPLESVRASEAISETALAGMTIRSRLLVMEIDQRNQSEHRLHKTPRDEQLSDGRPLTAGIEHLAVTRTDRLRLAAVEAEIFGKKAALERLATLDAEVTPGSDLAADAQWLRMLYEKGPAAIPEDAKAALTDRHGWFARLALAYDQPENAPARQAVVGDIQRLIRIEALFFLFRAVSILIALVAVISALVWLAQGRITGAFDAPAVGGSVYLEAFVLFLVGLMVMLLSSIPFRGSSESGAAVGLAITEMLQWGLFAILFWPMLRGVGRHALQVDLGLHTGEGLLKEIGCGVTGFFVDTGVVFLLGLLRFGIMAASGADEDPSDPAEKFPLFEEPLSSSWLVVLISLAGTVFWAPLCEEIAFRGCLYRFLHKPLRWAGAAVVTAAIFGACHPYDIWGLLSVASGGFVYAMLREWRSSLIAPMTAHFLHNGIISANTLAVLSVLSG